MRRDLGVESLVPRARTETLLWWVYEQLQVPRVVEVVVQKNKDVCDQSDQVKMKKIRLGKPRGRRFRFDDDQNVVRVTVAPD